jgi:hypothetical protein
MNERPGAVHFVGHAMTAASIKASNSHLPTTQLESLSLKGDALILENPSLTGQYLHASSLRTMISHPLFLAFCHDPAAAKVFLSAGAKQVVAVHQNAKLVKKAENLFTSMFYSNLWNEGSVVEKCFETARMAVEVNYGSEQA